MANTSLKLCFLENWQIMLQLLLLTKLMIKATVALSTQSIIATLKQSQHLCYSRLFSTSGMIVILKKEILTERTIRSELGRSKKKSII